MKYRLSIRASLTVLAFASALPLAAYIVYDAYSEVLVDVEEAGTEALRAASSVARETESALQRAQQLLATLSKRSALRSLDPAHCAPIFTAFTDLYPEYTNLLTVNRDGLRICSAVLPPPGTPASVDPRLYLSETLRNQAFTLGQISRGVFTHRWIMIVAQPLMDDAGAAAGAVATSVDLARLRLASDPASLPPQAIARVVDAKGMILASSVDPEIWIGKDFSGVAWFKLLDSAGPAIMKSADIDGVGSIFAAVPIKGTNWHAAVGIPVDILYVPAWRRLARVGALSLAALVLASLLAFLIARRTAQPIESIAKSVRRAAVSSSPNGIDFTGLSRAPREIRSLATDFEAMLKARSAAETQLRESDERFRQISENIRDVFFLRDPNGNRMLYVSPAYEEIWGRSCESLYADPASWGKAIHPDDRASTLEKSKMGMLAGPFQMEYRIVRPDGAIRWLESRGFPVGDDSGKIVRIAGIVTDITEKKRVALELSGYVDRLEVLRDTSVAILAAHSPQEIVVAGLRNLRRIVPFWGGTAMTFNLASSTATILAIEREPGAAYDPGASMTLDQYGLADLARLKEGEMCVVADLGTVSDRPAILETLYSQGMRSYLRIPLMAEGTLVGALNLAGNETAAFSGEHAAFGRQLADALAISLQQTLLRDRIRRLNRVYAVLSGINTLIVRVRDRDELYRQVCGIAVELGQFKTALIGSVDQAAMRVVHITTAGVGADLLVSVKDGWSLREDTPTGNNASARAIREKKSIVANDLRSDDNRNLQIVVPQSLIDRGILSMAVLPLLVSGEAVGVLALLAGEAGFFDEEEMKLLTELAGDIAFAIDNIEKRERLDYLAYYDQLTGLANRRLFLERMAQYKRGATNAGHKVGVMLIDLERFKSINDSLGRVAGDKLLKGVADWLALNVGGTDLVARLDADHFALIVPELRKEDDLARLVEHKLQALLDHPFQLGEDSILRVAAKAGVAVFPDDGEKAEILLRNAEAALKQAKASGTSYLCYTRQMTETRAAKLTLENQLRQAVEQGEFVLHYQPKINLVSGKLTSAEALIRWNNPRTGLVPPGHFIPVLEDTGLIHQVGRWALGKAIEDYLRWRGAGLPAVRIAVNVSSLQLRSRDFVDEIRQVIGMDAQAAAGLELELTESLIMEDIGHNIDSLRAIRELGVTIAIDDFGTGFSSLAYLAKLPVDTLKIDRSFVIDMTSGADGLALVSAIINLAHSLKLKVVAEGVETEEQSRLLRSLSCDEMQGYLFSKPVPAEVFEKTFLARNT